MRSVTLLLLWTITPALAQPAPAYRDCAQSPNRAECTRGLAQQRSEWATARAGGYTEMRNVAFCLWTGCDGAVVINQRASCQWRRAIMKVHRDRTDGGDDVNFAQCINNGY